MNCKRFVSGNSESTSHLVQWVEQHYVTRWIADHGNLAFFYGIFLFLYEVSVLRNIVPVIHPPLIAWAGILVVYDIFVRRLWKNTPFWKLLLLFMISAIVTAVANLETGIVGNAKAWIMTIIPLTTFYPVCITGNSLEKKRTLVKAMLGGAVVVFLCSVVALGMYLARISKTVEYLGKTIAIGLRYYIPGDPSSGILLSGLNEDTNHSAAYALVFAAFSLFLILNCRKGLFSKKWINRATTAFAVVNLLVQLCYFPLANSRGGWLSLVVSCVIIIFLFFFCTKFDGTKCWKQAIAATGVALGITGVICVGIIGVRSGTSLVSNALNLPVIVEINNEIGTSQVINATADVEAIQTDSLPETGTIVAFEGAQTDVTGEKTIETVGKSQADTTETTTQGIIMEVESTAPFEYEETFTKADVYLGSGRIWIWTEVLNLFMKKPILGNGPGNNVYFAQKFDVAQYSMGYGKAVHNSYLDLLLNYGVVGFVLMMAFWILCVKVVLIKMWINGKHLDLSYYLVAFCVLLVAITSMFLSSVFINTTAVSQIMFVLTGYLVTYESDVCEVNSSAMTKKL